MLGGRYRIERYLASGGFGNTYVATDTRFNGLVAVKEFFMRGTNHRAADHSTVVVSNAANQAGFDAQLDKFRREAQRIFTLRNDHIVHVIDLFDANGTSYYVMDFIDGESLSARVKQAPLSEAQARDVAGQLLDALDTVHRAGFFHLDVKPGNIMIDRKGHCTLIDFGASKQLSAMERTSLSSSGMAYTPGYAPIEQEGQRTKSIGPWTDLYAVGATLYHLLTGQTPPEVDPDDTGDDGRMFAYPAGVSMQMQKAISRLMNPSPRRRPQNVEQAKAVLAGRPLTSGDSTNTEETVSAPMSKAAQEFQSHDHQRAEGKVAKPHNPSGGRKKLWFIVGAVAVCIAVAAIFLLQPSDSNAPADTAQVPSEPAAPDTERTYTVNGVEFKMISVEGGTFTMGATSEQDKPSGNESPAHEVTLSDFCIGETEVTQALWRAVMGSNPSEFKGNSNPVESVSWNDCQTFIDRLNAATEGQRPEGRSFRLPTETEWEYAARGGNKSRHTQYAGSSNLSSVAWYSDNSGDKTHPVAKKAPNELGLYDMSGNVWEWCQDWYDENYYSRSPSNNPSNNNKGSDRVIRGGGWYCDAWGCRVAYRVSGGPGDCGRDLGLRLAL